MARMFHRVGHPAPAGGRKVFLATPAYQGVGAGFAFALSETARDLDRAGIGCEVALFSGDCHVDDARNRLVRDFLETDCTDLFFLDADMRWDASDLIRLVEAPGDIVGATYPLKQAKDGYPVRWLSGERPIAGGLVECEALPTGFLRIRRHVLEKLAAKAETFAPKSDGRSPIPLIFERTLRDGQRWGGDYTFCMKWREAGGRIFVDPDVRLEHAGEHVWNGSLASHLRAESGHTLRFVVERLRAGETDRYLSEAIEYWDSEWVAAITTLATCVRMARAANGPIIEAGSGLSTILMAAVSNHQVWCMEHDPEHAQKLEREARKAGVNNIVLCLNPLKGGFYDIAEDRKHMPPLFALGVLDGPPRAYGDRMAFLDEFGDECRQIVVDDADNAGYAEKLRAWSDASGREVMFSKMRVAVIGECDVGERLSA